MPKLTGFNYNAIADKQLRDSLKADAKSIKTLLRSSSQAAVDIGKMLTRIRGEVGSKEFRAWLLAEFEWSAGMAWSYIQSARVFGESNSLNNIQPYALRRLSLNHTPVAAVEEALALAESGKLVTGKLAGELITKHGGAPKRNDAGKPHKMPAPSDALQALQAAVKQLTGHFAELPLSKIERDKLAQQFTKLAKELRSVPEVAAVA